MTAGCISIIRAAVTSIPVESELSAWARDKGLFDEIEESWVYGVEMKPDFAASSASRSLC